MYEEVHVMITIMHPWQGDYPFGKRCHVSQMTLDTYIHTYIPIGHGMLAYNSMQEKDQS